jgi:hypothetical protein
MRRAPKCDGGCFFPWRHRSLSPFGAARVRFAVFFRIRRLHAGDRLFSRLFSRFFLVHFLVFFCSFFSKFSRVARRIKSPYLPCSRGQKKVGENAHFPGNHNLVLVLDLRCLDEKRYRFPVPIAFPHPNLDVGFRTRSQPRLVSATGIYIGTLGFHQNNSTFL